MPVIEGAVKEVLDKTEWAAIVFWTNRNKEVELKNSPLFYLNISSPLNVHRDVCPLMRTNI